jgi:hypothetical protein
METMSATQRRGNIELTVAIDSSYNRCLGCKCEFYLDVGTAEFLMNHLFKNNHGNYLEHGHVVCYREAFVCKARCSECMGMTGVKRMFFYHKDRSGNPFFYDANRGYTTHRWAPTFLTKFSTEAERKERSKRLEGARMDSGNERNYTKVPRFDAIGKVTHQAFISAYINNNQNDAKRKTTSEIKESIKKRKF